MAVTQLNLVSPRFAYCLKGPLEKGVRMFILIFKTDIDIVEDISYQRLESLRT